MGRGLWIARRAMLMKSALRDWLFCVIRYEKHYFDQPPPVASPPFGALRHHLPPAERWDYKDMKGSLLIVDSTVLLYRWRQPPKRGGDAFPRPQGGCKGFIQTGTFYNLKALYNNPRAGGASNQRTFGAIAPSVE